jgi:hypothetical protein
MVLESVERDLRLVLFVCIKKRIIQCTGSCSRSKPTAAAEAAKGAAIIRVFPRL